jgi:hypothetical protein
VDRINSKYGDGKTVVYFEERKEKDMRLAQRLAFFAGSDVLMITPTRYLIVALYNYPHTLPRSHIMPYHIGHLQDPVYVSTDSTIANK